MIYYRRSVNPSDGAPVIRGVIIPRPELVPALMTIIIISDVRRAASLPASHVTGVTQAALTGLVTA